MKPVHLFLIGLTGNIATGKSTVVAMLARHGASTIDADKITHQLQQPGMPVYHQIVSAFGSDICTYPEGPLDRRKLGSLVFSNPDALQRLEHMVHPAVHAEILEWLKHVAATHGERHVAVVDAIKLLESGWKAYSDSIWVVTCPQEQQITRLMRLRGMSEQEAKQRVSSQPTQASKIAQANVVIDTSGTLQETEQQVQNAWDAIWQSLK